MLKPSRGFIDMSITVDVPVYTQLCEDGNFRKPLFQSGYLLGNFERSFVHGQWGDKSNMKTNQKF